MRSPPWDEGTFDCVISWFTSFGYFDDDENRQVLREACRILRPGGRLLLENNNLAGLLRRWMPAIVMERDGALAVDRPRFDPVSGRARTERIVVRDGQMRRFVFSVRVFIAAELRSWLLDAGFAAVEFYGEGGEALTADGRRMITVASR
jgi:SAM-dependent methyltransferase